jgi:hypothetical protein
MRGYVGRFELQFTDLICQIESSTQGRIQHYHALDDINHSIENHIHDSTPSSFHLISEKANAPCSASSNAAICIAGRLKIRSLRPLQIASLNLLLNAQSVDTKFIQAPTGVGKDLLPFAMAVIMKKVQLVFVPFVALISNVENEGEKYGCTVIKFSDIYKTMSMESAAASADVIVLSYEHTTRAVRLAQELSQRDKLGKA